jgi:hypothetical protein
MSSPAATPARHVAQVEQLSDRILHVSCRHTQVGANPSLMRSGPDVSTQPPGGGLTAQREPETDALSFHRADGTLLLTEAVGGRLLEPVTLDGGLALHIQQRWLLPTSESLYGLGQHQDGIFDWRGHSCLLAPGNRQALSLIHI